MNNNQPTIFAEYSLAFEARFKDDDDDNNNNNNNNKLRASHYSHRALLLVNIQYQINKCTLPIFILTS
jgi:hypothetical protein